MALGERRALQLGRRDHRHLVAEEGGERLHVARRMRPPAVAADARPAQHVDHLAAEQHPVADQPVLGRGRARWRSSVSAVAVVVGATVVIGPPAIAASVGSSVAVLLQLLPPEAVEHEQHDLVGAGARRAGIHDGSDVAHGPGPSRAGMMPRTLAPT